MPTSMQSVRASTLAGSSLCWFSFRSALSGAYVDKPQLMPVHCAFFDPVGRRTLPFGGGGWFIFSFFAPIHLSHGKMALATRAAFRSYLISASAKNAKRVS